MSYHCSVNYYPAPGQVQEADDADAAEAAYRKSYGIPDHLEVEAFPVELLPNGGWRRLPAE